MSNLSLYFDQKDIKSKFDWLLGNNSGAFLASLLSIVASNDLLKDADPASVYNVAMTAASMQLPINPNLGFAYIIPYQKKKKDKEWKWIDEWPAIAQFQMWYKWFKQLALRSDQFVSLHATDVREWEIKVYDRLTGDIVFDWISDNKERDSKPVIGYVSNFRLKSWFSSNFYMTIDQLKAHGKKYSQSYKKWYGLRVDDPEGMYLKTVTKLNLSKNAPLSVDMQRAIIADQGVIKIEDWADVIDWVEYPDNPPLEPDVTNTMDEWLLLNWTTQIDNCKTVDELSQLHKQNKPTDPTVLDLFTKRKNELNQTIQS